MNQTPSIVCIKSTDTRATPGVVYDGLLMPQAAVSPAFFYDELGSQLFNAITLLDEYQVTRDELEIFTAHHQTIAEMLPNDCCLIDLGAGNCAKAASLFNSIKPAQYLAIDVSEKTLRESLSALAQKPDSPTLSGLIIDFSKGLPSGCLTGSTKAELPRVFFYPGSSIGNFQPSEATAFLQGLIQHHNAQSLVIGVDLIKPAPMLEAAYNDALGVTAAFNRNILRALNHAVGTDFEPRKWQHVSYFNTKESRIEMHLQATEDTRVSWPGGGRLFRLGETIHTENSYKYTEASFSDLLERAGFKVCAIYPSQSKGFAEFIARP